MSDYLKEGQEVDVIVLDVDRGRIKLSIKEMPGKEGAAAPDAAVAAE